MTITRPQRNRQITQKAKEFIEMTANKQQQKSKPKHPAILRKEKAKQLLTKKIEKRQAVFDENVLKEISKPFVNNYDDIIQKETQKKIEGMKYDAEDPLLQKTMKQINAYPKDFLPQIFNGATPLYIENDRLVPKKTIYLSKLKKNEYNTKPTNSDTNVASSIETLMKIPALQKYRNDDLSEFIINHREVFYHILVHNIDNSISTLKGYIVKLMRVLYLAMDTKNFPVYIKYQYLLQGLIKRVAAEDDLNTLNPNEQGRFLDWEVIQSVQKEKYNYFNSIANKKSKQAYDLNMDLILISLYTLTPPLRHELLTLQFSQGADNTQKEDYVKFTRNGAILELNRVKKRHNAIEIPIGNELGDILKQSLQLYPRKHLFTSLSKYPIMDKPVSEGSVSNRLRKMFIQFGKDVGTSILRSIYVTYRFEQADGKLSGKEITEMAKLMRTSPQYIHTSYRKIIEKPVSAITFDENMNIIDAGGIVKETPKKTVVVQRVVVAKPPKDDPYVKQNEAIKKKYHENDEYRENVLKQQKQYKASLDPIERQRRKVISMIKSSDKYRKSVKPQTLAKYNINMSDYITV